MNHALLVNVPKAQQQLIEHSHAVLGFDLPSCRTTRVHHVSRDITMAHNGWISYGDPSSPLANASRAPFVCKAWLDTLILPERPIGAIVLDVSRMPRETEREHHRGNVLPSAQHPANQHQTLLPMNR